MFLLRDGGSAAFVTFGIMISSFRIGDFQNTGQALSAHRYIHRIEAFVEPPNAASRILLEKLGFSLEGTLREHEMCRGELIDIQILGLLKKDWKKGSF